MSGKRPVNGGKVVIEKADIGGYIVLRHRDGDGSQVDRPRTLLRLRQLMREDPRNIAVSFDSRACLSIESIALLVSALETVLSEGREVALIAPTEQMCKVLSAMELSSQVRIARNETELQDATDL